MQDQLFAWIQGDEQQHLPKIPGRAKSCTRYEHGVEFVQQRSAAADVDGGSDSS